ncbi:MAG TPA: ABC transporter ATP-binding protein [Deinococcales bacterium]|nr:ABC transporter ATP-binding protein [Deinococcales bacterium]
MNRNALEISGLQAGYGKVQVLWDVNLTVGEGEFVTVIGANGAGKTTTLRTVSSLIRPRAGHVRLFGKEIAGHDAGEIVRLGLGHVPEGRQLFPLMSVAENLELGASPREDAWKVREQTRQSMFELFPRLAERQAQIAGTLSGGEQQMLAVARALMALPKVLLVDEPSLGLSPKLTQTVFHALRDVNRLNGVSVLLVEQNVRQSLLLADRAYVLEDGRTVQEGTGRDLLADPRVQQAYLAL